MLCRRCTLLTSLQLENLLRMQKRSVNKLKKKIRVDEERKNHVFQYVRDNTKPTERVYVWGCATTGSLGISSYLKPDKTQNFLHCMRRPARLKFFDDHNIKVSGAACGYGFTIFLTKKGSEHCIFGTGINTNSQIGFHRVPHEKGKGLDYVIEPIKIDIPFDKPDTTHVTQVACGRAHTILLTNNEGVYSLGNNAYGQCGRTIVEGEVYRHSSQIHRIKDLPDKVTKVVCGQDHTLFLTNTGEVYSCGLGADGQTGLGHHNCEHRPTLVQGDLQGVKVKDIGGSVDCVLAVSEEGELFGWGNSEYNQLAMVTDHTQVNVPRHLRVRKCGKVAKAVAGGSICALLTEKGHVFVWGYGILGKGPNLESAETPQKIPPALFGQYDLDAQSKLVDISCGISHFMALSDSGNVYSWGKNRSGCLGLYVQRDQFYPLKVSMPAETYSVICGVDHNVAFCRSFA
ncbi:RCC1-like G exchanging factor-like protein [Ylistrum balloti]|uniref:RCC1-like G exchanging factor-like protein n=1 Tax=Ylistrum balloti TaxID=509963 RepID=UPI002905BB96|nr:RCC1-like G exchanging factor-like protein [Ylistrum balloti]